MSDNDTNYQHKVRQIERMRKNEGLIKKLIPNFISRLNLVFQLLKDSI